MQRPFQRFAFLFLSSAMIAPASGFAAGFYLQEQSVSGLGAAFAGQAAMPRDASTVYFNPAGMTHLQGTHLNAGVHVIAPDSDLTDTGSIFGGAPISGGESGNPYDPTPLPNVHVTHQVTDDFWIGIGAGAPFGIGNEYDDGWFGRYDSLKSDLQTMELYPSAAYRVNDMISVGGGLIFQYADAELTNAAFATSEGLQTLEGRGYATGLNVGILAEPWAGTRLGFDYRSEVNNKLDGRLKVVGSGGADTDIAAHADLHLPDIANFSVAHDLDPQWTLLGSATWFGWDDFDRIEVVSSASNAQVGIVEQNYQNTWAFAAGVEYAYNDAWTLRAGYQFDETPTTDEFRTTRTPDGDRNWFTAGGTYTLNDQWSFDFAGAYIDISEENIKLTRNSGSADVNADTEGSVMIFSGGLNYKF